MIKALATDPDGKSILVIGLSFDTLARFTAQPGDTFIRIEGHEFGLTVDVMIFSGESKEQCAETISGGFGPDMKVHIRESG